ncbi:MAG: hypothetical protein ACYDEJ_02915 [Desulfitobacteriaceae bacterium]
MPKSSNQKLNLLYLYKILHDKTDEQHTMTVPQMITELAALRIKAERKTIYDVYAHTFFVDIAICWDFFSRISV